MSKKTKRYTGCIGSIEKARDFARELFVYGLKSKSEHTEVSPRAYDEAARQMGDWFQDCLQTKIVNVRDKVRYLSLDCREYTSNPLYKMWKACSFTTNEIVFFFFIIDYLSNSPEPVTLTKLYDEYCGIHRSDGFLKSSAQNGCSEKASHGISMCSQ